MGRCIYKVEFCCVAILSPEGRKNELNCCPTQHRVFVSLSGVYRSSGCCGLSWQPLYQRVMTTHRWGACTSLFETKRLGLNLPSPPVLYAAVQDSPNSPSTRQNCSSRIFFFPYHHSTSFLCLGGSKMSAIFQRDSSSAAMTVAFSSLGSSWGAFSRGLCCIPMEKNDI